MTASVQDLDQDQVLEAHDHVRRVAAVLQVDQIAVRSQEAAAPDLEALDLTVAQEAEVELARAVLEVTTADLLLLNIQAVDTRLPEARAEVAVAVAQEARTQRTIQENQVIRDDRDQLKAAHLVLAVEVNPTILVPILINSNCKLIKGK